MGTGDITQYHVTVCNTNAALFLLQWLTWLLVTWLKLARSPLLLKLKA